MKLSQRLMAVAQLVEVYGTLADVGCDHGYLPIALYEQGKIKRAIALDVNEGPLLRAREHIEEAALLDVVETRLSDGLMALSAKEVDSVVIAGMGGNLMKTILSQSLDVAKSCREIILQPQSEIELLRAYLSEQGFEIIAEDMVCEGGKFYPMMRVCYTQKHTSLSEIQLHYGPCLIRKQHPVLIEFLNKEQERIDKILKELRIKGDRYKDRITQLTEEKTLVEEALRQSS
ncbi:tRNA (adenine(22)-N(1))-methyltransferase [Eubacterium oxidoreducens]|uniref:tRNA (Adenine22-N1)-methyltransferase n=1 Tax=Eubacterium oxidoreducens TaxID=1732 RepID=A0A1G6BLP0_EUBOX|nr:class I SAM-dependent methyltransferase [Eubacterium oxidoreducens]SDB21546.1 tRNA (adenine22-N1)-methyltransferase [Eubacterium oxidoreducens]